MKVFGDKTTITLPSDSTLILQLSPKHIYVTLLSEGLPTVVDDWLQVLLKFVDNILEGGDLGT